MKTQKSKRKGQSHNAKFKAAAAELEHDTPPRCWHEVTFRAGGRVKTLFFGAASGLEAVERAAAYLTAKYTDAVILRASQQPLTVAGGVS